MYWILAPLPSLDGAGLLRRNMDYIARKAFAESIGLKDSTVRGWQERHWTKGQHYVVIGKTTMLVRSEVEEWLNSGDLRKRGPAIESRSWSAEKRTPKISKATSPKMRRR